MVEAIERFFAEIDRRGPELLPPKYSGTIRIDLSEGQVTTQFMLIIEHGRVQVRREDLEADCVVQGRPEVFGDVITGRRGLYAAVWRNLISVEGQFPLLTPLRELLAIAPDLHQPTPTRPGA
ncbi:SCP2 sterol-binding domain-containing protein [Plantactinospora siamensis]|uniref:SCP2 sterol-binding domain-containing protein n=1 Tax=Plantactinospora siamensis TaxID=555372 RepID=A0ABV6NRT3_9ACTN